ncbi:hypothetical protein [Candidatus Cardinium hertigii]|uniref:Outer membrane protein beta-barrel domain-containing protein n=1 Tax=Candidatus Cardinium hertigii TaxID=247481 RepID=A0A2Z3L9V5_9BACT|nr:hypothetical protein [Candidatus Cardinium hertigii]AWN82127.1 hypothetical protein DK880_00822 [Candidatus Cardinium hertigii]
MKFLYQIASVLLISILACTSCPYKAQANQDESLYKIGVNLGISSTSFRNCWTSLEPKHFELGGKVEKGNFFGKPKCFGMVRTEIGVGYLGTEIGVGYLCQGGILNITQQPGEHYLKITRHTITIPIGVCIYPLKLERDKAIWKIAGGLALNLFPKTTWMVKKPGQASEKEMNPSDEVKTLLNITDVALYLGTGYEWACGFSIDMKAAIGLKSLFRTKHYKVDAFNSSALDKANQAYTKLHYKCNQMSQYYFTVALGYSLHKAWK